MRARHGVGHGVERNRQVEVDAVLAFEKAKLTPAFPATAGRDRVPPHRPQPDAVIISASLGGNRPDPDRAIYARIFTAIDSRCTWSANDRRGSSSP
jgi:hypothetical protein